MNGRRGRTSVAWTFAAIVACAAVAEAARAGDPPKTTPAKAAEAEDALVLRGHRGLVRGIAFSPDGSRIATAAFDGTVRVFDAASGALKREFVPGGGNPFWAEWSPTGTRIAVGREDGAVTIHDPQTGVAKKAIPLHRGPVWSGTWSASGRIATAGRDGTVRWFDPDSSEPAVVLGETGPARDGIAVSPDGMHIACAGDAPTVWDVGTLAPTVLPKPAGHGFAVAFSADGKTVALAAAPDPVVRLCDAATGAAKGALWMPSGHALGLSWSSDGTRLAACTTEGALWVFDPAKATRVRAYAGHAGAAWCVSFSPDGKRIVSGAQDGTVRVRPYADGPSRKAGADLRPILDGWGLVPRGQGARGTCSVFVMTEAYEFALARKRRRGVRLSPEFVNWAANEKRGQQGASDGQFFHAALAGIEDHGVCPEEDHAYAASFDPARVPSETARTHARALRAEALKFHWIRRWTAKQGLTAAELAEIRGVLDRGYPVGAGSNHSLLIVGYEEDRAQPGGGSFYALDSGAGAYGVRTFEFVQANMSDLFWVGE